VRVRAKRAGSRLTRLVLFAFGLSRAPPATAQTLLPSGVRSQFDPAPGTGTGKGLSFSLRPCHSLPPFRDLTLRVCSAQACRSQNFGAGQRLLPHDLAVTGWPIYF